MPARSVFAEAIELLRDVAMIHSATLREDAGGQLAATGAGRAAWAITAPSCALPSRKSPGCSPPENTTPENSVQCLHTAKSSTTRVLNSA